MEDKVQNKMQERRNHQKSKSFSSKKLLFSSVALLLVLSLIIGMVVLSCGSAPSEKINEVEPTTAPIINVGEIVDVNPGTIEDTQGEAKDEKYKNENDTENSNKNTEPKENKPDFEAEIDIREAEIKNPESQVSEVVVIESGKSENEKSFEDITEYREQADEAAGGQNE